MGDSRGSSNSSGATKAFLHNPFPLNSIDFMPHLHTAWLSACANANILLCFWLHKPLWLSILFWKKCDYWFGGFVSLVFGQGTKRSSMWRSGKPEGFGDILKGLELHEPDEPHKFCKRYDHYELQENASSPSLHFLFLDFIYTTSFSCLTPSNPLYELRSLPLPN